MDRFKDYIVSGLLVAPVVLLGGAALADDPKTAACSGLGGKLTAAGVCDTGSKLTLADAFKTVANTLIFLVGAISVIMVVIGALRYVLSGGDSAGVKSAKDTILYSLIGVVVAIVAYAIVSFVISRFSL